MKSMNKILGLAVGLIGLSGLSEKKSFLAKRKNRLYQRGPKSFTST